MCKLNKKNRGRRIDPCMVNITRWINIFSTPYIKIIGSCCGHGKYPPSIIVIDSKIKLPYEIFSDKNILRKKFYKYDKQGYPYIPEVLEK